MAKERGREVKPFIVTEIELPEGTLTLLVSSQRPPAHAWGTREIAKLTWKYNDRRATGREAAGLLLQKARAVGRSGDATPPLARPASDEER